MLGQPTRAQLAALVDHTLLKPETTRADVAALVAEAAELGVYAVCVSPSMVPVAVQAGGVRVAAVTGFPSGKHVSSVKAHEAAAALASGASEIDMVIDIGAALCGDIDAVRSDIEAVRAAAAGAVLKVIVESAVLLGQSNAHTLVDSVSCRRGCRCRLRQNLDWVSSGRRGHGACRRADGRDGRPSARGQSQRWDPHRRRRGRDAQRRCHQVGPVRHPGGARWAQLTAERAGGGVKCARSRDSGCRWG